MEKFRTIQIPKKRSAITFVGCIGKQYKFVLHFHKSSDKDCELHDGFCFVEGKRFDLTDEQMSRFQEVYQRFQDDYELAKKADGFHSFEMEGNTVYFRRLVGGDCQFIAIGANGDMRQDTMPIYEYVSKFAYFGFFDTDTPPFKRYLTRLAETIPDDCPLLHTGDKYFDTEMKHICKRATKADMEYLNSVDGGNRFYKDKDVYGTKDIAITDVKRIPPTFFNRSRVYVVYFSIDGKAHRAIYSPRDEDTLEIYSHGECVSIGITTALKAVISKIITDKNETFPLDKLAPRD